MARWLSLLSFVGAIHLAAITGVCDLAPNATVLQVNALVGINGASAVQCWSVQPPFTISEQPGTVGAKIFSLGNSTGSTVIFFNETNNIDAGLHRAPNPQWVFVLQGGGLVTLPTTNATLPLPQGDVIIANDTADVSTIGHDTKWLAGSVVIQLPFADKIVPGHTIINSDGACPSLRDGHH